MPYLIYIRTRVLIYSTDYSPTNIYDFILTVTSMSSMDSPNFFMTSMNSLFDVSSLKKVFLHFPEKRLVVSQPEKALKPGSASQISDPN